MFSVPRYERCLVYPEDDTIADVSNLSELLTNRIQELENLKKSLQNDLDSEFSLPTLMTKGAILLAALSALSMLDNKSAFFGLSAICCPLWTHLLSSDEIVMEIDTVGRRVLEGYQLRDELPNKEESDPDARIREYLQLTGRP